MAEVRPKSLEQRAKDGEKLTLDELARVSGNFVNIPKIVVELSGETREPYSWKHSAAAQLHGWAHHAMATTEPLLISLADYLKALDSIDPPEGERSPVPHAPACSPYSPHKAGGK